MAGKRKKSAGMKKAQTLMSKAARAWNASSKKGKYTAFVKKFFKDHKKK